MVREAFPPSGTLKARPATLRSHNNDAIKGIMMCSNEKHPWITMEIAKISTLEANRTMLFPGEGLRQVNPKLNT